MDRKQRTQYRKLDGYLSFSEIALQTSPSKGESSPIVYSFHRPLSYYSQILEKTENFSSDSGKDVMTNFL